VVKEQIKQEVLAAHLEAILLPDETEVAAQFEQESLEIPDQTLLEIVLVKGFRKIEKVQKV
jgi:hypothetical protein